MTKCMYLELSTKCLIAQDIATYEGLYKITHLLDKFCDGLKKAGILGCLLMNFCPCLFTRS